MERNRVIKLKRVIEKLTELTRNGVYKWYEDQIEDHVSSYGITLNCPKTKKREGGFLEKTQCLQFQSFCLLLHRSFCFFFLSSQSPRTHDD